MTLTVEPTVAWECPRCGALTSERLTGNPVSLAGYCAECGKTSPRAEWVRGVWTRSVEPF